MFLPPLCFSVNGWLDLEAQLGSRSVFPICFGSVKPHHHVLFLLKLHQSQLELQEVRLSYRQLQVKVEELTEERSLQSSAATSTSLLSEIEQSMEAEELEQEREQVLTCLGILRAGLDVRSPSVPAAQCPLLQP